MKTFSKIAALACVLVMTVTVFQNVSANTGAGVPVDMVTDSNGKKHFVIEKRDCHGNRDIYYFNNIVKDWEKRGLPFIQISDSSQPSLLPRICIDSSSNLMYVVWIEEISPTLNEFWYSGCALNNWHNWSAPQYCGVAPSWRTVLKMSVSANDGNVSIAWSIVHPKNSGSANFLPDLDGDFIIDAIDVNPLKYDFEGAESFDVDAVAIDAKLGVSVAMDYTSNLTIKPTITIAVCLELNASYGPYINITVNANDNFTALIKMKFDVNTLPNENTSKYLRMYWLIDETNWTILMNSTNKENTGVNLNNSFVWALTSHFSTFTIADSTAVDSDIDLLTDGQEINADGTPDRTISAFSDGSTSKSLFFGTTSSQIVNVKIPVGASIERANLATLGVRADPYAITATQVTTQTGASLFHSSPSIYMDKLVYLDNRDGDSDVYLNNLTTHIERKLTYNNVDEGGVPKIWGNNVIWLTLAANVCMYDIATNITNIIGIGYAPDIYMTNIVWNTFNGYMNTGVVLYNITTNSIYQITGPNTGGTTHTYGDYVAYRDDNINEIVLYKISTAQSTIITVSSMNPFLLDIDSRYVLYDDFTSNELYAYDITLGTTKRITYTPSSSEGSFAIDGGIAVWSDYRTPNGDIYGYDISNEVEFQICVASGSQLNPAIYGDTIVWQDGRDTSAMSQIYMAKLGNPLVSMTIGGRSAWSFPLSTITTTTPDFSMPVNYYLKEHKDSDDGTTDGKITVPMQVTTSATCRVTVSQPRIEMYVVTTDPVNKDTDGDKLDDGAEVLTYLTNPTNPDTDGDGISEGDEVLMYYWWANPLLTDTDGDGLSDGRELALGHNIQREVNPSDWYASNSIENPIVADATASGGTYAGCVHSGNGVDWAEFRETFSYGNYELLLRVKSTSWDTGEYTETDVYIDGQIRGKIREATGYWQEKTVYLGEVEAGVHTIRLVYAYQHHIYTDGRWDVNIGWDYIRIVESTNLFREINSDHWFASSSIEAPFVADTSASEGNYAGCVHGGNNIDWVEFRETLSDGDYALYLRVKSTSWDTGEYTETDVYVDGEIRGKIRENTGNWQEKSIYLGHITSGIHIIRLIYSYQHHIYTGAMWDVNIGWDYLRLVECTNLQREINSNEWSAQNDIESPFVSDSTASGGSYCGSVHGGPDWVEFKESLPAGNYMLYLRVKSTSWDSGEYTESDVYVDGQVVGRVRETTGQWQEKSVYLGRFVAGDHTIRILYAYQHHIYPDGRWDVNVGWDCFRIVECANVIREMHPSEWSAQNDIDSPVVIDPDASEGSYASSVHGGSDWVEYKEALPAGKYKLYLRLKNTAWDSGEYTITDVYVDGFVVDKIKLETGQWEVRSAYLGELAAGDHVIRFLFSYEHHAYTDARWDVNIGWDYFEIVEGANIDREINTQECSGSNSVDAPFVADSTASGGSYAGCVHGDGTDWIEFKETFPQTGLYKLYLRVKTTSFDAGEYTETEVFVDGISKGKITEATGQWQDMVLDLGLLSAGDHIVRLVYAYEHRVYTDYRWDVNVAWDRLSIVHVDDTDSDGLCNYDECKYFQSILNGDIDGDDILNGPLDPDSDGDGVMDGADIDLTCNLKVSVTINRAHAINKFDLLSDADIYAEVTIGGTTITSGVWTKDSNDVSPNWNTGLIDVPDDQQYVPVKIFIKEKYYAWDNGLPTGSDEYYDTDCVLTLDLRTGTWTGDDNVGDNNGYGHTAGDVGHNAEVWFNVVQTDYDNDGLTYWEEINIYETSPTVRNDRYAIIVAGWRDDHDYCTHNIHCANLMRTVLLEDGLTDNNIYYLACGNEITPTGRDDTATEAHVQYAVTTWLQNIVQADANDIVLVYLVDHGGPDVFSVGGWTVDPTTLITSGELDGWLDTTQTATGLSRLYIVIDSCEAGSFIDNLQGNDRIIITSSDSVNEMVYIDIDRPSSTGDIVGTTFSNQFIYSLRRGESLGSAFCNAYQEVMWANTQYSRSQFPLIEDNNDGVGLGSVQIAGEWTLPNMNDGNRALKAYFIYR